ncbi:IS4 family transposase [Methylosinus sp. Sm6]|uniref:IS4 family transposase n=1 Tax=Methylosinus sp. Sm6 TaxID=2866948 RepID=UPI001C9998C3|nr:IS4 family transposase [Methylosinus sp. Sm6]MBY6243361.1 IS4 family transposase [Methylosinus sp. Sm6]
MRHKNTVFHDLLKLVPWNTFDALVARHGADDLVRSFTTRHQLIALLYAQFSGAESLRAIETAMGSHQARLYHLGGKAPARSTFADANGSRCPLVFTGLLEHMLAQADRKTRREMKDVVRLIDSTSLHLAGVGCEWARFSADVCGAKAHVIFDPDLGRPVYHSLTAAKINDITAAKEMPIEAGATYVFDLGYYDYEWWARLDAAGCRIVTRFKTNTPLCAAKDLPLAPGTRVMSDRIGFLPARQAKARKNPMADAVREIVVVTDTGKTLRLLSNDLDAPADEIADIYKRRWLIELFFRLMKQTLRIKRLMGRSQNAVRIQLAAALIAHLLLRLAQSIEKSSRGFLDLARLVKANLMHRKSIVDMRAPPPRHYQYPPQYELLLCSA